MSLTLAKAIKHPNLMMLHTKSFASSKCPKKKENPCLKEQPKKEMKSMWFNPKCCVTPCKDALPRYDELYYKPSNKLGKYQQTWVECPKLRVVPKQLCCYEMYKALPMERRDRKKRCVKTFKCDVGEELKRMCAQRSQDKCAKLKMPGCGPVRNPPRCFELRPAKDCQKIKAPFPAYSECDHPKPKPRRVRECLCLYIGPFCPFPNTGKK